MADNKPKIISCCQMYSRIQIQLSDGRAISFSLIHYKALNKATVIGGIPPKFIIADDGQSINWPELEVTIEVGHLLDNNTWMEPEHD